MENINFDCKITHWKNIAKNIVGCTIDEVCEDLLFGYFLTDVNDKKYFEIHYLGTDKYSVDKEDYEDVSTWSYFTITLYENGEFKMDNNLHLLDDLKAKDFDYFELYKLLMILSKQTNM